MTVINSNSAAMLTANSINQNERMMTSTMERLSTGKRINSAADDAAGLAIATKMTSQIRGLDQAGRNANNATSMIQLADGSAEQISNIFAIPSPHRIRIDSRTPAFETCNANALLGLQHRPLAFDVDVAHA